MIYKPKWIKRAFTAGPKGRCYCIVGTLMREGKSLNEIADLCGISRKKVRNMVFGMVGLRFDANMNVVYKHESHPGSS